MGLSVVEFGEHRIEVDGRRLTVSADGPHGVSPACTVMSFLAPERPFDADVVRSFCHFVHFFASAAAAHEWTAEHPGTFSVSVDDGFPLGQRTNAAAFGAAPAWTP